MCFHLKKKQSQKIIQIVYRFRDVSQSLKIPQIYAKLGHKTSLSISPQSDALHYLTSRFVTLLSLSRICLIQGVLFLDRIMLLIKIKSLPVVTRPGRRKSALAKSSGVLKQRKNCSLQTCWMNFSCTFFPPAGGSEPGKHH